MNEIIAGIKAYMKKREFAKISSLSIRKTGNLK